MTEPLPSTQTPSEPLAYQPISGWAITGFAIGSLFALLVVVSAIAALIQGAPFFYPMWVIGIAVVGVVVSLFGQRHVQSSEGTRAGAKLARWGLRLSVISGLMYTSYYYVTRYTIQVQANDFVMEMKDDAGFIPRVREGVAGTDPTHLTQLNTAFLLTRAPNDRSARPDNEKSMRQNYDAPEKDGKPGQLTQFRDSALPRILYKQLGKEAEITPLAVLDWRYEKRSYKVVRSYRIKTKETEVDFVLAVYSVEAETAGEGRKWFVNLRESGPLLTSKGPTPLGDGVTRLRKFSSDWLKRQLLSTKEGGPVPNFKQLDKTPWDLLLIETSKPTESRGAAMKKFHDQLYQAMEGGGELRVLNVELNTQSDHAGKWEQDADGKIRLLLFVRFTLRKGPFELPVYPYAAIAVVESQQPIDPGKFKEDSPAPDWKLISFEFTSVMAVMERK
jgi:hypothetical protein